MAKLSNLRPRVETITTGTPVLVPSDAPAGPRFYNRRLWRDRIRPTKLRQDPLCADCQAQGLVTLASEVDHVDGNPWNNKPENHRSLCKPCHSRKTVKTTGGRSK